MRWAIVGASVAGVLGLSALGYGQVATLTRNDEQNWRQQELAFLKSVHGRIREDLAHQPAGAATLRGEDRSILQAMVAIAGQMARNEVPDDIKVLLSAAAPPNEEAALAPAEGVTPEPVASPATIDAGLSAGEGSAATPPPDGAAETPGHAGTSSQRPPRLVEPQAEMVSPTAVAEPVAGRTLVQIKTALRAEKTARGLRIWLPTVDLFGTARDTFDPSADPSFSSLAELIMAMKPREIVVIEHAGFSGEETNLAVSRGRAHAVATWLAAHIGNQRPHFVEKGSGSTGAVVLINATENPQRREQTRDMEILLRRY